MESTLKNKYFSRGLSTKRVTFLLISSSFYQIIDVCNSKVVDYIYKNYKNTFLLLLVGVHITVFFCKAIQRRGQMLEHWPWSASCSAVLEGVSGKGIICIVKEA